MHFVSKWLSTIGMVQGFAMFIGTALATWLVAEVSYRFFEVRFLSVKGTVRIANRDRTMTP
jgi:peptidoglycan/LPS O-acetylase OafA/YrhL